jgi:hypothetical protein
MPITRARQLAAALAPAVAAFLLVQACGGSDDAIAQAKTPDPLIGVWEGSVTLRDCATQAVVATFYGSQVFHQGGTMSDTNTSPTASRGPGWGTWASDYGSYIVKFRFFTYDAAGNYSGVIRTTRNVTVGPTPGTATSVNSSQIFDASGALVRTTCGSDVGTKVL